MKNFKKGAFSKGGDFGSRPKFGGDKKFGGDRGDRGGDRGGFGGGRPELFSAICSNCGKPCELPFRPSGDRPVFCRDCFDKKDDARGHSSFQRTERPREFRPAPREGGNNQSADEVKKQLANLEYKMDKILKMLSEGSAHKTKEYAKESPLDHKIETLEVKSIAPKTKAKKVAPKKAKTAPKKSAKKK
jgi:CxxC-x17-CxxC domain-containing protein